MRPKRVVVGVIAALAVFWSATPADAQAPVVTRFSDDNDDDPDVFEDACGPDADLIGVFERRGSESVYFDGDGRPIRVVIHDNFNGVLTRADTGNSIRDPGRVTIEFDLVTGAASFAGLQYNMVYPGVPPVFQFVGHVTFDPETDEFTSSGPNDFDSGKDPFEEACRTLA
jgi:hypothetical protein